MAKQSAKHFTRFTGNLLSKIIARTARRHLDGRHVLFRVYLQTRADLYLLTLPIKMAIGMNLTSTEVSTF